MLKWLKVNMRLHTVKSQRFGFVTFGTNAV